MGGRPPKFSTPEELETKIVEYFAVCTEDKKMPTKAGLALHLDTTRETLGDYIQKDGFSYAIKRAYDHIEEAWNQKLAGNNATGPIFYLKAAFSYRDRVDVTTNDKDLPQPLLAHVIHSNDSSTEAPETE